MHNNLNHAGHAAMSNLVGMSAIAASSVHLALALGDMIDEMKARSYENAYVGALEKAKSHARGMEIVAREAVSLVADLEVEIASLKAACAQRHEYLESLKS